MRMVTLIYLRNENKEVKRMSKELFVKAEVSRRYFEEKFYGLRDEQ